MRSSLGTKVDLILDGGRSEVGVESTIISFLDDTPRLLRAGGLAREVIEDILGRKLLGAVAGPFHSPGQLASHYAPSAALRLNAVSFYSGEAALGFGNLDAPFNLSPSGDVVEAAANLFAMLHQLDAAKPKVIAVAAIPMQGLGEAINDRLTRAAAPRE